MLMLSLQLALASAPDCVQCCQSAGMTSCPTQLRVYGENSIVSLNSGRYQIKGIWVLECEGTASFLEEYTLSLPRSPTAGEVLTLNAPDTVVGCFDKHCRIPPGACIENVDERYVLVNCASNRPLTAAQFGMNAPSYINQNNNARQSVVIGGQTLQAEVLDPQDAILSIPNSSRKLVLPPPPTKDCQTSDEDRRTALRRVEQGDQFRMKQLYSQAASEYEAALSIDPCNGLAWSSVGQLAVDIQQFTVGIQALKTATQLLPKHYGVWTVMGSAYELMGSQRDAMLAYRKALQISPAYLPAQTGLQRVSNWTR